VTEQQQPQHDDDQLMSALADLAPPPRKTDAAFARSVADGVRAKRSARSPFTFALPTAAAAAAAFAFVAVVHTPSSTHDGLSDIIDAGNHATTTTTMATTTAPATATSPVELALALDLDDADDDDGGFALPSLEGSSDEELERLDKALDAALGQR
jgi:hypothetical protein